MVSHGPFLIAYCPENANCPESVHALGKGWWSKSGQVKENTFPFQTGKKKPSLSKQKRKHFHFPNINVTFITIMFAVLHDVCVLPPLLPQHNYRLHTAAGRGNHR